MKHIVPAFLLLTAAVAANTPENWWNAAWSQRQAITIDAGPNAADVTTDIKDATALVRLHDGNFNFLAASGFNSRPAVDNDGVPNILEFAFGGSPVSPSDNGISLIQTIDATGDTQPDLTLTVEVRAGASFSPLGKKLTASHDGITYLIEGSLDLSSFDSEVSEVIPHLGSGTPKSGYEFKTFRLNASSGLSGNGFLRAGAVLD